MNDEPDYFGRTYSQDGVEVTITVQELAGGKWHVDVFLQHLPVLVDHTYEDPNVYSTPEEAREWGGSTPFPRTVGLRA
jgi:hypothetical protein